MFCLTKLREHRAGERQVDEQLALRPFVTQLIVERHGGVPLEHAVHTATREFKCLSRRTHRNIPHAYPPLSRINPV